VKILLQGFRLRVVRTERDSVLIEIEPRYAEAVLAAMIAAPFVLLLLADWFLWPPETSLFQKVLISGRVQSWLLYAVLMLVPVGLIFFCGIGFVYCVCRRRFLFENGTITFRGVPGTGRQFAFDDVQSILLFSDRGRHSNWSCHVMLELEPGVGFHRICINCDQLCEPAGYRAMRGPQHAEWLIKVHRPLAELIAGVIGRPVRAASAGSLGERFVGVWP
jgi:hypothetical protein